MRALFIDGVGRRRLMDLPDRPLEVPWLVAIPTPVVATVSRGEPIRPDFGRLAEFRFEYVSSTGVAVFRWYRTS